MVKLNQDGTSETVDKHRAKGIQRAAAAKLTHAEYKAQLKLPAENFVINRRLGSRLHKIYGIEVYCKPHSHTSLPFARKFVIDSCNYNKLLYPYVDEEARALCV